MPEQASSTLTTASHDNVAPADEAYAVATNAKGQRKEHSDGGPRQPRGSDGPTFPPPIGVDHDVLREAGVAHTYFGVEPEAAEDDDEDEAAEAPAKQTQPRGQHPQRQGEQQ